MLNIAIQVHMLSSCLMFTPPTFFLKIIAQTKAGARANLGVKTGRSWWGTTGKSGDKLLDFLDILYPVLKQN